MRRFTGHKEPWGKFLDIKENAASVLEKELKKAKKGLVLLSSVTDPYQPIEKKYELTREILKTLLKYQFPVSILTKSSLVLRDVDLFKKFHNIEVGITITTTIDSISKIFEPYSSRASERISTLGSQLW
jgi:DNA repair photolyase